MAIQKLTTTETSGFFKATEVNLEAVEALGKTAQLGFDLNGAKNPCFVIIDIPAESTGKYTLTCKNGEYNKCGCPKTVELTAEAMNIIPITGFEVKDFEGWAEFELSTDNIMGLAALGVKAGMITHRNVENH